MGKNRRSKIEWAENRCSKIEWAKKEGRKSNGKKSQI
jgi:hypothetical protein